MARTVLGELSESSRYQGRIGKSIGSDELEAMHLRAIWGDVHEPASPRRVFVRKKFDLILCSLVGVEQGGVRKPLRRPNTPANGKRCQQDSGHEQK